MEGYTGTLWWALEAGSVVLAIAAMWLDAFRYKANWIAWSLSNVLLLAALLPRQALGPIRDDLRLPGDQRRRLVPVGTRRAAAARRRSSRRGRGRVKRGLVFGKFLPLHRGHQLMIETALSQVDDLTIVVYDSRRAGSERMPVELRLSWLSELYPQAGEHPLARRSARRRRRTPTTRRTPRSTPRASPSWAASTASSRASPATSDLRVSWVREHVLVDEARTLVPTSGTVIRSDPYAYRGWMDPLVYSSLIERVVFVGTESTGKSTLAKRMAKELSTLWTHEFGRELWEAQGPRGLVRRPLEDGASAAAARGRSRPALAPVPLLRYERLDDSALVAAVVRDRGCTPAPTGRRDRARLHVVRLRQRLPAGCRTGPGRWPAKPRSQFQQQQVRDLERRADPVRDR